MATRKRGRGGRPGQERVREGDPRKPMRTKPMPKRVPGASAARTSTSSPKNSPNLGMFNDLITGYGQTRKKK